MTQQFSLYEDLSIEENLDFVARLYALDRAPRAGGRGARAAGPRQPPRPAGRHALRRLEAAAGAGRLLLHEPKLLLLDEPTAGVDPKARREFWDEIHGLAADGMTVLVSTHYMDEAERCHRIAYIAYGRLLTEGTIQAVIAGSDLVTWRAEGRRRRRGGAASCAGAPGVEMVAPFGTTLHVSGTDPRVRSKPRSRPGATRPGSPGSRIEPTLEDVFIHLMAQAEGQFRMTGRCFSSDAPAGDDREGVHPDAAGPADLRDDGRHPDHPAHSVRLRDQHRPQAPADRRSSPTTTATSPAASSRPCRTPATTGSSGSPQSRAEVDRMLDRGEVLFAVTIPAGFTRELLRGDRPAAAGRGRRHRPGRRRQCPGRPGHAQLRALEHDLKGPLGRCAETSRRSSCASTAATTRKGSPATTSCRAWSARS